METSAVTIIVEVNIGHKVPTISVYVVWGEYDSDDPMGECGDYRTLDNARKVIGPIDAANGQVVCNALIDIFKAIGLRVFEEETADD